MSGNHAQDNWYQPGTHLPPTTTTVGGSNSTYSTLNTWYTIQNTIGTLLMRDYTAPTTVECLLILQFECATDTAARYVEMCIMDSDATVLTYGIIYFETANKYRSLTIAGIRSFTIDETTSIMGRIRLPAGSAQTVTLVADTTATKLILLPITHP